MATDPNATDTTGATAAPADDTTATADDSTEGAGGYTIEIHVSADDTITVSVETEEEEDAEHEATGTEPEMMDAKNIREALKKVMEIYSNAGKPVDTGAAEAQMSEGYGETKGGGSAGGM